MEKNVTEVVFILDKSGSMSGQEADVIGGFNSMIEKQQKTEGKVWVSTVLFNHKSSVLHDRVDLSQIKPLTRDDYFVDGNTALLDAVGGAIRHISNIHKYARKEDVPAKTLFIVHTDGMENASRTYTRADIKQMIKQQEENCGWEFLFAAANIDTKEFAADIGVSPRRVMNYNNDIDMLFDKMDEAVYCCRVCDEDLTDIWNDKKK